MATKTIYGKAGQDIFDITLQQFGDLENTFDFLVENSLTLNDGISSGLRLKVTADSLGDTRVKEYFVKREQVVINADDSTFAGTGDYNDDFNNDFLNI